MHSDHARAFIEVADRCFVKRYPQWDVSVGLVLGSEGAVVIDTRASTRQGAELVEDVRRFDPSVRLRWAVNTHKHFDHAFGNAALEGVQIYAHENAAGDLIAAGERLKALIREDPEPDPAQEITAEVLDDVLATQPRLPDVTFSSVATIDLGDRYVELAYPGRGHTDGDILIRVPDADVVFAGDLIEESGPPAFGTDSYPLDWADSLDLLIGMLTTQSVVVPGHGRRVDREFVKNQRAEVSDVGELIRSLHFQKVSAGDALDASQAWPYPREHLRTAVERGYQQLGGAP
jgi:glyoxylase-like metal-dependent hydrolase (beta-lactamase superfamily II)